MARLALPLLACVAAALLAPAADPPDPSAGPKAVVPAGAPVRVMSFNIRYGTAKDGENAWDRRKEFLAETVAAFDPDLLGTQETLADQRDFLAGKLTGYAAFAAGREDGRDAGEMAAVFYRKDRFEKLDGGHFWLSETPDKPGSKGWDALLPRVATWVKLKDRTAPDGKPVLFLNAHLDHRGAKARLESARLIRSRITELGKGCRVVVTGDFNAGEGSEPYDALFGKLDDRPSPVVDTFRVAHPIRGKQEGTASGFKATATGGTGSTGSRARGTGTCGWPASTAPRRTAAPRPTTSRSPPSSARPGRTGSRRSACCATTSTTARGPTASST